MYDDPETSRSERDYRCKWDCVCPAGVDLVLPCGSGRFFLGQIAVCYRLSLFVWKSALPHWLVVGHSALPAPALQVAQAQSAASVPEFLLGRLTGTGTILGVYYVPSSASTPAAGSNSQALASKSLPKWRIGRKRSDWLTRECHTHDEVTTRRERFRTRRMRMETSSLRGPASPARPRCRKGPGSS